MEHLQTKANEIENEQGGWNDAMQFNDEVVKDEEDELKITEHHFVDGILIGVSKR
jgi:hypothetical protein